MLFTMSTPPTVPYLCSCSLTGTQLLTQFCMANSVRESNMSIGDMWMDFWCHLEKKKTFVNLTLCDA